MPKCTLTSPAFPGESLSVSLDAAGDREIKTSADIGIVTVEGSKLIEESLRSIWPKLKGVRGGSPSAFDAAPWGYSDWDDLKHRLGQLPHKLWNTDYSGEPESNPFTMPDGVIH